MQRCKLAKHRQNKKAIVFSGFLVEALCCSAFLSQAQRTIPTAMDTRNYTRVWEAGAPVKDPGLLTQLGLREVKQSTTYHDGLGRPEQTVVRQGSLTAFGPSDLVSPVVYDAAGRESQKYLPFVVGTSDGLYKENPLAAQNSFYSLPSGPLAGQQESAFYAMTAYEPSPLGRVTAQMAPGASWAGSGRGITTAYQVNTASDSVRMWEVSEDTLDAAGFGSYRSAAIYPAGSLFKTLTSDEAGKKVVEFKDKEGQVVLKKVEAIPRAAAGHQGWLSTYYIYDDMARLRAVLQPRAVEVMMEQGSWTPDATTLAELSFRYAYDQRGRMTIKKVPGAGPVYMVYDARDRLVMTQDANMRKPGLERWLVTVYDELNRPVKTALWSNSQPLAYHLAQAYNSTGYPSPLAHRNALRRLPGAAFGTKRWACSRICRFIKCFGSFSRIRGTRSCFRPHERHGNLVHHPGAELRQTPWLSQHL
jgi:hypothetical protein